MFDAEPSRKGGHWVREGVADRSGHWTRVDQTRGSRPLSSLGDQDLPTATPLSTSLQLETATIGKSKFESDWP